MIKNPIIIDGNHAAALIAHQTNEVIAIYPITPSSPMGELSDEWSSNGRKNLWGAIPEVIEMQSEGGAAGTVHGALQAGALTTTFTSSQGLLLMIPNMYKIAGELTPTVFHVAARSLAAQALSIFGDHSDVMAIRPTGFGMLSSNSVQEALDMALIAQAATLESRIPMVHFFDGFRTSHEVCKIENITDETVRAMIDDDLVQQHRDNGMSPDHPVIRGTSQNPDVYFQARETVNPYYRKMPEIVQSCMDRFAELSGRQYRLFDYVGAADAEHIIILMGSGCEAAHETVDHLLGKGEKIGIIKVRLYRPFASETFLQTIPESVRRIAVLDRTKEPGADGEPLYKDIMTTLADRAMRDGNPMPLVTAGRYGLSSKEFTPAMIKGVFDELKKEQPKHHFTVGIRDDVTFTNLEWDASFVTDANDNVTRCLFYGLGSDGTVSANKNSIKIIGEQTDLYTQGYFVYDSKKAGAVTVSHLRFGPDPIRSTYLIGDNEAEFVACHQPFFLERYDMLDKAAPNGVFLLNTRHEPDAIWERLPHKVQRQIIDKNLRLYVIDAYRVAEESGMGRRINTVMQTCFFAISGILPKEEAIDKIKAAVEKTYGRKGRRIVERNFKAIDSALANLHEVSIPSDTSSAAQAESIPQRASEFVNKVTLELIAERGDQLPVSLLPDNGTWPLGTAALEKRNLALQIPVLDENLCIHCGKCPFVCPHAAIRSKAFPADAASDAPESFKQVKIKGREFPENTHIVYQVAPEDCTGCGLCVEICPAKDKSQANRKALNMEPYTPQLREQERINWDYFLKLPEFDRNQVKWRTMKGSMLAQPLFEFSGACVGCGETPYIKLATQLFGDRMMIANATGCSSIYGGNLPTTPYTTNEDGRGPTWNNSLFEDNAEFGLGFRLAVDQHCEHAQILLKQLGDELDPELAQQILDADQSDEVGIHEQRQRVATLVDTLKKLDSPPAQELLGLTDYLVKKSVWIVGGDGWAYDIGFGGLDHAMASGRDINILVLDTEVYSNTGGQASKATPLGAVAKFAASGKGAHKKDLAMIAMAYENVYVAHVAFGAKDMQTLRTFMEAEAYPGPSLIIAYSPCIAHGIDLKNNLKQQELAIKSGHWQLFRFDPRRTDEGKNPLQLDSKEPSIAFNEFADTEIRFSMLRRTHPEQAEEFMRKSGEQARARFDLYKQLADIDFTNDAVLTELPEEE
ncbi:MAG: pyruvate:ferredoxin (flavodoxin) oxidoreductase [Pseudomonadota bacterium]|nr:pyruvate:ferredoxin (flavodoxin) oxidoreductase [Pseudomonadota bacterium]